MNLVKQALWQVILFILLIISLLVLSKVAFPLLERQSLWSGDYDTYWLSGRLFLRGENPYSLNTIRALKVETGIQVTNQDGVPIYPPWSIPIMALLGIYEYQTGRKVWILLNITIVFGITEFIWKQYGGPARLRWLALLVTLLFAPTIFVLGRSQMSLLVLLGIAGTLYFLHQSRHGWLAGVSLVLAFIKPHVAYLFLLALMIWSLRNRRWGVLVGGIAGPVVLIALALLVNPALLEQYLTVQQPNYSQLDWMTPTFGIFFRSVFGYEQVWLQFTPPALGLIWLAWYWSARKDGWDWDVETPRLLLASALSAIFIWTYDLVILIPLVLTGTAKLVHSERKWLSILLIALLIGINIAAIWMHRVHDDSWFIWFTPTILIWYLVVLRVGKSGLVSGEVASIR